MNFARRLGWVLVVAMCVSAGGWAQRVRGGMGIRPPEMPGAFKPVAMMMGRMQPAAPAKDDNPPEKLGSESVTVPAGTFTCEHFRKQGASGQIDFWVATEVSPYGVVKMTGPNLNMVLQKVLSNETSHIKGEPQKMPMPQMPHY